jgi:predicted DNA-binding antitoxin AbrB/MazE fold protein
MTTIHAVYENGVFKPTGPVALPEACEVEFEPRLITPAGSRAPTPTFLSDPNPTPEEFGRILDAMASLPPTKVLPPDFSRDDIYDDHD